MAKYMKRKEQKFNRFNNINQDCELKAQWKLSEYMFTLQLFEMNPMYNVKLFSCAYYPFNNWNKEVC
jgi:hypothetical protein